MRPDGHTLEEVTYKNCVESKARCYVKLRKLSPELLPNPQEGDAEETWEQTEVPLTSFISNKPPLTTFISNKTPLTTWYSKETFLKTCLLKYRF